MNLGKNMMLDTADNKIYFPRFYDIDTICSYDNSGQLKFDVDIEMEQGYWNTSSSRLWTRIRDLMHDDIVTTYNNMRQNGVSYENMMHYIYDEQIAKIPQSYFNKDYDIKYAPFADSYIGMAHGDTYEHVKRWLKQRFTFVDTLFDYAPSYNNDVLTIRANTTELMTLEIETYTPVYQHLSWYNGQMDKKKIDGKVSVEFSGTAQAATDQEVLIYGGSNVKSIKGITSMNPNRMLIGSATKLIEIDAHDCPLLADINANKANLSPHEYLNKVNLSNCPLLEGNLRLNNSPLVQEINIKGTKITGMNLPSSIRNLQVLRLPNTMTELTLNDASMLHTLDFDKGVNLQSVSMTNCNALENVIGLDLLQTPSITLNNSYNNVAELYFKDTTNLSLSNMSNLERVIFTPNNEYETFEMINVANAPDYKVTTFNCPKLSTFMTTAPYRESYNNCGMTTKSVTTGTLVYKDFSPNGTEFSTSVPFDYYNDVIEAEIDLTNCEAGYTNENILSFATTEVALGTWGNTPAIHIYYTPSSKTLNFNYHANSYNINKIIADTIVNIKMDKGTIYLNNEIVLEGSIFESSFSPSTTILIGSKEGSVRSTALYKLVGVNYGEIDREIKDYGNIQPNTTFTANSIDISNTQFTDVKLLCTTDTNTLKLPTTVKNFYCDSSFDLDTDYLEDGEYDVVHGELVEQYTTDYEGEVNRYIPEVIYYPKGDSVITTDFIKVVPGTDVSANRVSGGQGYTIRIEEYKSADTSDGNGLTSGMDNVFTTLKSDTNYIKLFLYSSMCDYNVTLTKVKTPNLIPSSADGSLIFSMYAPNKTVAPQNGTWDLKGLQFDNFHTYGMNNDVRGGAELTELTVGSYREVFDAEDFTVDVEFKHSKSGMISEGYDLEITYKYNTYKFKFIGVGVIQDANGNRFYDLSTWDWDYVYSNMYNKTTMFTMKFSKDILTIYHGDRNYVTSFNIEDFPIHSSKDYQSAVSAYMYTNGIKYKYVKYYTYLPISMPARYDDYNITIKNANISPKTHNTMLYPLLVNEDNPITGTLDYTNYAGKHLSWSFAYTDEEYVNITQPKDELINSYEYKYNAFYDTEYEFDNPYEIARYTSSASGVLPGFNTEFTYTYDEINNGDGTYTTKIYADDPTLLTNFELDEVSYLRIKNAINLTSVNIQQYDNLRSLHLESLNINPFSIITNASNLEYLRLIDIDFPTTSSNMRKISKLKGMNVSGNEIEIGQSVSGKVTLVTCMDTEEEELKTLFPLVEFTVLTYVEGVTVTFYDGDNNIIYTTKVPVGGGVAYEGKLPTKTSDAQYDYVFDKWNRELEPIIADTIIRPVFKNILRSYTIRFLYPDYTVISTQTVHYGSIPAEPDSSLIDLNYAGWTETIVSVTGDKDYIAKPVLMPPDFSIFEFTETEVNGERGYDCKLLDVETLSKEIIFPVSYNGLKVLSTSGVTTNSYKNVCELAYIPRTVEIIGDNTFNNCQYLKTVEIHSDNLTHIGKSAFSNCRRLTGTYELPETLTSTGTSVFYETSYSSGTSNRAIIILPSSLKVLNNGVFSGSYVTVRNVKHLEEIKGAAFSQFKGSLNKTEVFENVKIMSSNRPFYNTNTLSGHVVFPSLITILDDSTNKPFQDPGDNLLSLSFPKLTEIKSTSIITWGSGSTGACKKFKGCIFGSKEHPVKKIDTIGALSDSEKGVKFLNIVTENGSIDDIEYTSNLFKSTYFTKKPVTFVTEDNVDYALFDDYAICIGSSVTSQSDITIKNTIQNLPVTKLSYSCFQGNTYIRSVVGSNLDVGKYAFCRATSLKTLTLSGTINCEILSDMFTNCSQLTSLDLSNWVFDSSITTISSAFYNCTSLKTLDLSSLDASKITTTYNAFNYCNALTTFIPMKNISYGMSFTQSTSLSVESMLAIIENLSVMTSTKTLTLGTTLLAKLSEDQIAVAVNKGWTIA